VPGVPLNYFEFRSDAERLACMMLLLEAVQAIHALGVVHRDLKPDNIIVHRTEDGQLALKLIDFGAAKVVDTQRHQKFVQHLDRTY